MWCVFIILGIVAEVLKANAILAIPTIVEYIFVWYWWIASCD